jgi:hypothetical protein
MSSVYTILNSTTLESNMSHPKLRAKENLRQSRFKVMGSGPPVNLRLKPE